MFSRCPARFAALIAMLLLSARAGAAIAGIFSGLSHLIDSSDQIVVAMVLASPESLRASTLSDAQPQRVRVLQAIEGNLQPQTDLTVTLRTTLLLGPGAFEIGERYVLFIRAQEDDSYAMVSIRGSAFRVATTSKHGEFGSHDDVRGSIETLLIEAVTEAKARALSFEQQAAEYLESP